MDMPFKSKLAVCTPFAKYDGRLPCVTVEWHRARSWMVCPAGYSLAEIISDGYETGVGRNLAVKEAQQRNLKYLFFLDWDVLVPAMTLVRLVYLGRTTPTTTSSPACTA